MGGAEYIVATVALSGLEVAVRDDMTTRVRAYVGYVAWNYVACEITDAASNIQEQLMAFGFLAMQGPPGEK